MITENFPYIAQSVSAHASVEVTGEVYIGEECELGEKVKLIASSGRLIIGKGTKIGNNTIVDAVSGRTTIGDKVSIGTNCHIEGNIGESTVIEDDVKLRPTASVGSNCVIKSGLDISDTSIPDNTTYDNSGLSN